MTVTAAMSTILPAMHQLTTTENAPQTEEDGRQKPQMEKDGYLSGFDFANRRVINLRNEWSCAAAICRGTPP